MKIKMLVMDVDGTLTDGRLYIGANGEVMKAFDVRDGYAIAHFLPDAGIIPVIITNRQSRIVEERAKELRVAECHQGLPDKLEQIIKLAKDKCIAPEEIAYIGDDLSDLECMKFCGFRACPNDAVKEIKAVSDYVCEHNGGRGAVRELIERLTR